ncbi:MAG: VWA domain-containing protein [Thermodesulfobacteriota bacterium]
MKSFYDAIKHDMYTLSYPWLLLLLPLPLLVSRVLPPYRESKQAIRVPWFQRIAEMYNKNPAQGAVIADASKWQRLYTWLAWLLIIIALARPQFLEPPIEQTLPTRDILLLVDLSGSMETRDFTNSEGEKVDRLSAVKEVLDGFLSRRDGDRVGLVVFGNAAFVQVPFTRDLEACRLLLSEMAVRMAGPRTAFGDAIGLGISLFQRSEMEERVMIALTDGNDTGSKVLPTEAAKIARDNDIVIHVVGVGDPTSVGEEMFDEEQLRAVAAATGGTYFFGADREELEDIYIKLDTIGTHKIESKSYRPRNDLFHWPLALFTLLALTACGMNLLKKVNSSRGGNHG